MSFTLLTFSIRARSSTESYLIAINIAFWEIVNSSNHVFLGFTDIFGAPLEKPPAKSKSKPVKLEKSSSGKGLVVSPSRVSSSAPYAILVHAFY